MKKFVVFLSMLIVLSVPTILFAFDPSIGDPTPTAPDGISPMVKTILGAIQWIGYAISLGMLIYIGIKYTMSAANEKAELKRMSVNFVIGAIVIAGAVTLCNWSIYLFKGGGGSGSNVGSPGGTGTMSPPGMGDPITEVPLL